MNGDAEFMRVMEEQGEKHAKLRAELERVNAERARVAKLEREADEQVAMLGLELQTERERAEVAERHFDMAEVRAEMEAQDAQVCLARAQRIGRENYGLLLMLIDAHGDVSATALRATAESKVREALGEKGDE